MTLGVIGRKCGMTRVFTDAGSSIPVTVVEVTPNLVTQVKTEKNDGYQAVQITTGTRRATRVNKAQAGVFAKANVSAGRGMWELRGDTESLEAGQEVKIDQFEEGQKVDVTGTTIGKGFAGTIKRHNFRGGDNSHGNSLAHRAPGSIGMCQTPGRVLKGKKMSGQMGNKQRTVQGLEIVRVDSERNLILIKGAVPGSKGADLFIRPAVKTR